LRTRRLRLEAIIERASSRALTLSPLVDFTSPADLISAREAPPSPSVEGLMLKRWASPYLAGRVAGHWYKWKRDPFLIDAVLLYAQRGHGKRSGFFSDFTFGVWKGDALTPVGKAYFGFTDEELRALDKFVRTHTIERFGPVSAVEPKLVLEVAFEGLQVSPRHKSGLAMRFPRIHRIRWDKPASEADRIEMLEAMLIF
jgi:DNA ligase-1